MDWERVQRLIDIQERLASDLDEMVTVVMTDLHEEPYTLDEVHIVTQNKSKGPRFLSSVQFLNESKISRSFSRLLEKRTKKANFIALQKIIKKCFMRFIQSC